MRSLGHPTVSRSAALASAGVVAAAALGVLALRVGDAGGDPPPRTRPPPSALAPARAPAEAAWRFGAGTTIPAYAALPPAPASGPLVATDAPAPADARGACGAALPCLGPGVVRPKVLAPRSTRRASSPADRGDRLGAAGASH